MSKSIYDRRANPRKQKEPGANREALINALAGYKKPRVDTKDPQAIAERIDEYLHYCMEHDLAPGIAMCANWLGINIHTLERWYSGFNGTPEHQRIASRFYGIVQGVWEQDMHEGTINPVSGIFVGKAFYGYKDTQEIVIQQTTTEQLSASDLIAESKRLPGAETLSLPDNASTIDADFRVIEGDKAYDKTVERAERKANWEDIDRQKTARKEYSHKYYLEHKEDFARYKQKALEKKAQKVAEWKRAKEEKQDKDTT